MTQTLADWIHLSLQTPLAGNRLQDWMLAAAWLTGVALAVRLVRPLLVARLAALASRTAAHWDDAAVQALRGTRPLLLTLVALYPAVQSLTLPAPLHRWLIGAAAIGLFVQTGLWASRFAAEMIRNSRANAADAETVTGLAVMSYLARLVIWSLVLLALLDNLGFNVTTLLAGLGVGGIAVGLALQNILGDLFSSLSIVLDKPFQIGHFVVIDNYSGTVENIGLKTTRIRSLSGEMLVFSNTDLTKARLRNFKFMQERRIVFTFGVTYDTPPELLRRLPAEVRDIVQTQPQARFDRAHFKDFGDSSLNFEVVYWMTTPDYTAYMDTQQAINFALLERCAALGVEFAFPTRTVELQLSAPLPVRAVDSLPKTRQTAPASAS